MTSPKIRRSGLALLSTLAVLAFYAHVPGASAHKAPSTASGAVSQASRTISSEPAKPVASPLPITVTPDPAFDPYAPGTSSAGVTYVHSDGSSTTVGGASSVTVRHNQLFCLGSRATIIGTSHADRIYGTKQNDVIVGLGGNDLITAGLGDDLVCGDGGQDQIYGLDGRDRLDGGSQPDGVYGGNDDDRIYGGKGDDVLGGDAGTDYIFASSGNDTVFGGTSAGTTPPASSRAPGIGQDSFDYLYGGPGNDAMSGGDGNDNMYGQGGNDTMYGDDVSGQCTAPCNDRMVGGPGRDTFFGGEGDDTITGGDGDNSFDGGDGNDTMTGGNGIDAMWGGAGIDTMHGGAGPDLLNGNDDNDAMYGDGGSDTMCGGGGVNTLSGGSENDFLSGNADNCTFSVANLLQNFSIDTDVNNLLDGGPGTDLCVSPSTSLSPQTVHCEFDGFLRLNVLVQPQGNVSSGGAVGLLNEFGIDCNNPSAQGDVCSMFFLPSEMPITVTLTATPAVGFTFNGWNGVPGGVCPGVTNPCVITFNAGDFPTGIRTITANFVATTYTLTVIHTGTAVSLTSNPGGINCGGTCSATFQAQQSVTLTAGTAAGTTWTVTGVTPSGGCGAGQANCTVTMTTNGQVTVNTT